MATSRKKMDTNKTPPSSIRVLRNQAEKQRRDKFNLYVNEMASLVPIVSTAPRKLDKTSTIRLCANYLRIHQNIDVRDNPTGRYNSGAVQVFRQFLENMDAFLMVVSCSGKIIFVSDRVEKILGHSQTDMMGVQLSCYVHETDQDMIHKKLSGFATKVATSPGGGASPDGDFCVFETRLAGRLLSRGEPTVYERVRFSGKFRGPKRRPVWVTGSNGKDKLSVQNGSSEPMLVAVVQLLQPQNTLPALTIIDSMKDEYITKHSTDGKIIQTDHRISIIAGYFMEEVMGYSAFRYIHEDDLNTAVKAQTLMLSNPDGREGRVTYRLKTRIGKLVFLRSRGIIEYDSRKQVVGFVCINSMISEQEGLEEIRELQATLAGLNLDESAIPAIDLGPVAGPSGVMTSSSVVPLQAIESPRQPLNGTSVSTNAPIFNGRHMNVVGTSPLPELSYSPPICSTTPPLFDEPSQIIVSPLSVSSPIEIQIPFPWQPDQCNSSAIHQVEQTKVSSLEEESFTPNAQLIDIFECDSWNNQVLPSDILVNQHLDNSFESMETTLISSSANSHFTNKELNKPLVRNSFNNSFPSWQPMFSTNRVKNKEQSQELENTFIGKRDVILEGSPFFKDESGINTGTNSA